MGCWRPAVAILESYFPSYRMAPEGATPVPWEAKYEIYLNFAEGRSNRILVSANSRYWSMGGAILNSAVTLATLSWCCSSPLCGQPKE